MNAEDQARLLQGAERVSSLLKETIRELLDGKPVQAYRYAERANSEIQKVETRLRAECPSCGGEVEWEYKVPNHYITGTCKNCNKDFNEVIRAIKERIP
jgi:hypothetical protein